MHRGLVLVQVLDEGLDAALVLENILLAAALIQQSDAHTGVEERKLAQALGENVVVKLDIAEGVGARLEQNIRAGPVGLPDRLQGRLGLSMAVLLAVGFTVAMDGHDQPLGQGIDHRHADPVQAPGDLVGVVVELTAGVEHGHDDLGRGPALVFVHVHGDAAAVVDNADRFVLVNRDVDFATVAGERFVDGVVDGLEHHVVQTGAVVRVSNVHARSLSDRVQAFENLDIG